MGDGGWAADGGGWEGRGEMGVEVLETNPHFCRAGLGVYSTVQSTPFCGGSQVSNN